MDKGIVGGRDREGLRRVEMRWGEEERKTERERRQGEEEESLRLI
jgi:hypothetical protein